MADSRRKSQRSIVSVREMFAGPLRLLPAAIQQVPAVRYALAAIAVAGCVAAALSYFHDPRLAVPGIVAGLALMGLMVVFAQVARLGGKAMRAPAVVFVWCCLVLFIVWSAAMTTSVFAGWPLHISLFGPARQDSAILIVPDAEAVAMMPPQRSPFTVSVAGRSIPLAPVGVLIGATKGVPDTLRAVYRTHVPDGEPVELRIAYTPEIAGSIVVRYDDKVCKPHPPGSSQDTLWLIRFDECS